MGMSLCLKSAPGLSLAVVVVIALGARLLLLYGFDVVAPDGVVLIEMAKTFAAGDFFTVDVPEHHHEPLYPALIFAVSALTPLDYVRSGQLVSLASAVATIYLVYMLAKRLYGQKTGIYSALILSLVPLHALSSVTVLKESFYTLMAVAVIYSCALAIERRGRAYFFLTGLFLGLSYLVRFDGILLLLSIPFLYYAIDSGALRANLLSMFVLIFAALTLYAAYAAVLYIQTGEITISKKLNYYVTPVAAPEAAKEKLIRDYGYIEGEEIIKSGSQWRAFLTKRTEGLYKAVHYILPAVFPVLLMLFAGAGIGAGAGKKEMLLLLIPVIYAFVFPFMKYPTDNRYFLCVTPFFSVFAGRGLALLQNGLAQRYRHLPGVFMIIFLIVFAPWAVKPMFDGKTYRDELLQKEVGLFIRGIEQKERIKIVSPLPVVSFYAGARLFYLGPLKKEGEIIGLLRDTGADYAVLDDIRAVERLLKESKKKQSALGIEKIKEFSGGGIQVIVLKVRRCMEKGGYGEIQAC